MDMTKKTRELVSALCDGEIPDVDQELALAALDGDDGRQAWDLYHQIGDALRAGEALRVARAPDLPPGFAQRLAARLDAELFSDQCSGTSGDAADPAPQFGGIAARQG